jgi:hypothetical protein
VRQERASSRPVLALASQLRAQAYQRGDRLCDKRLGPWFNRRNACHFRRFASSPGSAVAPLLQVRRPNWTFRGCRVHSELTAVRQRIASNRSPASFERTCHQIRTATWRTDRHLECRTRRHESAVDRRPTIMSRRGCIGGTDQVWRPAVTSKERTSSVENPTFDALCGLFRRPAVTLCCYSIYVIW